MVWIKLLSLFGNKKGVTNNDGQKKRYSNFLSCSQIPCADPGIFVRRVQARRPENSSDNVYFSPQHILQFNCGLSMVYFKEYYNFQGFRGDPTFSRGVQLLPGGDF